MAKKYTAAQWAAMEDKPKAKAATNKKQGIGAKGWFALGTIGFVGISMATAKDPANSAGASSPTTELAASVSTDGLNAKEVRCLKVGQELKSQGVEGNDLARFIALAGYESKGCQNINNAGLNKDGTVDDCPLQINRTANADLIKNQDLKKLHDCVSVAIAVKKRQGWGAWSSFQNGHGPYRQDVPMALKLAEKLS
jgi:hypothetical protein